MSQISQCTYVFPRGGKKEITLEDLIEEIRSIVPIKILMALYEKTEGGRHPVPTTKFIEDCNIRSEAFYNYKSLFLKLKLITEEKEEHFPFRVLLNLTEKGRRFVEAVRELEEILRS